MSGSEKSLWRNLRKAFKKEKGAVAWKVEDAFRKGLPDVVYRVGTSAGFLELKYVKALPKRSTTNVWIGVTANQMRHLEEWIGERRGNAYVLVGIEREWLLLRPFDLRSYEVNSQGHPGAPIERLREDAICGGRIGTWETLFRRLA